MPKNKNRKQTPASDGDAAAPELPATLAADASIDSASSTHHALQPESETHDAVQAESTASSDANAIAAASSRRVDFVDDGPCGFAWVTVKPGNSSFARFLVKENLARKAYYGGVEIWISAHNQSYQRKMEHARAMAQYFRNFGIDAFANGRLD